MESRRSGEATRSLQSPVRRTRQATRELLEYLITRGTEADLDAADPAWLKAPPPDDGAFEFNITDVNEPSGGSATATVDDDGLPGNNPFSTIGDLDANAGDDPADVSEATFTGTLGGSVGLDVPGTF